MAATEMTAMVSRNDLQILRKYLEKVLESTWYNSFYIGLVVFDTLCIALQSSENIPDVSGNSLKPPT